MKVFNIPFIISILFLTCCQKNPLPDVSPLKCNYSSADISTLDGEQVSLADIVFSPAGKDGILKLFHNVSHLPYAIPEVTKEAVIAHAEAIKTYEDFIRDLGGRC